MAVNLPQYIPHSSHAEIAISQRRQTLPANPELPEPCLASSLSLRVSPHLLTVHVNKAAFQNAINCCFLPL